MGRNDRDDSECHCLWRTANTRRFRVHLEYHETIVDRKVMELLMVLEEKYPHLGRSLVDTYFPGGELWPNEIEYWRKADEAKLAKRAAKLAARAQRALQGPQAAQSEQSEQSQQSEQS